MFHLTMEIEWTILAPKCDLVPVSPFVIIMQ